MMPASSPGPKFVLQARIKEFAIPPITDGLVRSLGGRPRSAPSRSKRLLICSFPITPNIVAVHEDMRPRNVAIDPLCEVFAIFKELPSSA